MDWDSEIKDAKARVDEARVAYRNGGVDISYYNGEVAILTQLLVSRDNELARAAPAGRNAFFLRIFMFLILCL